MPPRFTLRQIYYFVSVADCGGIARAAEQINISSPSLSTAIAQLETTFGVQLFIRQPSQGLILTGAGQRFLGDAKRLLTQAAMMRRSACAVSEQFNGPASIGLHCALAATLAPAIWRAIKASETTLEWSPVIGDQALLIAKLKRGDIDVALTDNFEMPGDVAFEPLAALSAHAILPSDHALASQEHVTFDQLSREPLLLGAPKDRDYFLSLFSAAGYAPKIVAQVSDADVLRSMVENGLGYTLCSGPSASAWGVNNALTRLKPISDQHDALQIGVASSYRDCEPRIVAAFRQHCRTAIREEYGDPTPGFGSHLHSLAPLTGIYRNQQLHVA